MSGSETAVRIAGIFSLVALIGLGAVDRGVAQEVVEKSKGLYATRELTTRAPMGPDDRLLVRSAVHLSGSIVLKAAEQDEVVIRYTIQAKTDTRSKAIDYIDLISVSLDQLPNQIRLDMRSPNPAPWHPQYESGIVEMEVALPKRCFVEVEANYFDITARGPFKGFVVPSSLGRMDISDVTERLELSTANRRVNVERITGFVSVSTTNSLLQANDIVGEGAQAKFRNDGGDIKIVGFRGSINVRNRYGRISVSDFQPRGTGNFIRGSSGPIILDIVDMPSGQLVVNNRHEDIEITIPDTLQAFLSLAVGEDGVIEATSFPFTTDLVQRNRLNLLSGDGRVEISSSIRGQGNIYIRGVKGE